MFEWSEAKRLQIIRDRDLDFRDAVQVFDGRPIIHMASFRNEEDRHVSIALIEGKFYAVVWTWQGETGGLSRSEGRGMQRKDDTVRYTAEERAAQQARREPVELGEGSSADQ